MKLYIYYNVTFIRHTQNFKLSLIINNLIIKFLINNFVLLIWMPNCYQIYRFHFFASVCFFSCFTILCSSNFLISLFKFSFTFLLHIYIYIYLLVCLFVSNKRQNGWTVRPQFFVGPRVTPEKVCGWSNFQKFPSNKIRFLKILRIHEIFFIKSAIFLFNNVFKENMFAIEQKYKVD